MILYHFTARAFLDDIKADGLSRGEVPLSVREVLRGVWFTTDPDPAGHGLTDDAVLTDEIRKVIEQINGRPLPKGEIRTPNKRAVRITVKVPSSDRNLVHWPKWGRKRLDRKWYDGLNQAGGNKHKTWYIYFGTVPPTSFTAIDFLTEGENERLRLP